MERFELEALRAKLAEIDHRVTDLETDMDLVFEMLPPKEGSDNGSVAQE